MSRRIPYFLFLVSSILFFSCSATKHVPAESYLLDSYKIESEDGDYENRTLNRYIKQKPNKRIITWRFYLSLYNLSSPDKENGFHNWLRKIGEPPVVYDETMKARSAEQLKLYMNSKGFYLSEVSDTTLFNEKRNRAKVVYTVLPRTPYRIRDLTYFFHDSRLSQMVLADTGQNRFRKGELFDMDVVEEEVDRINAVLKDSGYYAFDKRRFIYFEVDSSLNTHQVDVNLGIRNYPTTDRLGNSIHTSHPVYTVRNVYMTTDQEVSGSRRAREKEGSVRDTVVYDSVHVVYTGKPNIRPGMVTQKNYIMPGSLFDASNLQRTRRNLSSLSASRMVDIRFREVEGASPMLDCNVLITPATLQSYTVKLEGTNSEGNVGAAANITYQHRNLFGGSELFELSFFGAVERLPGYDTPDSIADSPVNYLQEFGVDARLRIPKFLLPFKSDRFIRRYNPQTTLRMSYNYQRQPKYVRTMASASIGYDWRSSDRLTHRVYPVEASLILTPYKSPEFIDWLQGKYLLWSYEPHMILDARYSMIWSNKKLLKNQSFQDVRLNLETAGNMLYGGYKLLADDPGADNYQVLGVDFAQYVKGDIDIRNYTVLYEGVSLVLRGFAGVGFAYANSNAMPFEKQYFSGGANSLRAWQVKSLGPGSYEDLEERIYPNQTGDVKLEANMEYRFKLFWKLEAALFLDAGNIWSLNEEENRVGAGFEFNRFHKEIAVGTGVGTRAVFSFLVCRFDLGIPLRSPFAIEGSNWLPGNSGISGRDLTYNIAIGYPF